MSDDELDEYGFPMPLSERLARARGAKPNDGAPRINFEPGDRGAMEEEPAPAPLMTETSTEHLVGIVTDALLHLPVKGAELEFAARQVVLRLTVDGSLRSPEAEAGTPVAWRWRERDEGHWSIWHWREGNGERAPATSANVEVEFFYASPPAIAPAGEVMEAAREAMEVLRKLAIICGDEIAAKNPYLAERAWAARAILHAALDALKRQQEGE